MKNYYGMLTFAITAFLASCGSDNNSNSTVDATKTAISWPRLNTGDEFRLRGISFSGNKVDVTFTVHVLDSNREESTTGEISVTFASVNNIVVDDYANSGTIAYTPKRSTNTASLHMNVATQDGGSFIETQDGVGATLVWDPGLITGTINLNGAGIIAGETFTASNDGALQKVQFEYKRANPNAESSTILSSQ